MSSALTLMVPYSSIHATSAFADAFEVNGATWAKYVVAIGALRSLIPPPSHLLPPYSPYGCSGMATSLTGSLFALPRCVYAMANDGLLYRSLATVHPTTKVPTTAVLLFGALTAVIALLFDIQTLVCLFLPPFFKLGGPSWAGSRWSSSPSGR